MKFTMPDIGRLLATQDNRATRWPMFLVQQRVRLSGLDPRWTDEVVWVRDGEEVGAEETAKLEAAYEETGDEPEDCLRTGYVDQWEFVTCCFTEAAAQRYIDANGHNLREPRIYVESAHRNTEWIDVREHLLALAKET